MGSGDGEDDRTFRVSFTAEGFAKLRERVSEKLKEFMGDYTDDTLVVCFFYSRAFCNNNIGLLWHILLKKFLC